MITVGNNYNYVNVNKDKYFKIRSSGIELRFRFPIFCRFSMVGNQEIEK